jgi:glycosyltransferase involved in cell wall biosynthesis
MFLQNEVKQNKKVKVLWYSDAPICSTGFGVVAKNLLKILYDTGKYEFDVLGINYGGDDYDRKEFYYINRMLPAMNPMMMFGNPVYQDPYGKQRVLDELSTGRYDLLFILQDHFNVLPLAKLIRETYDNLPDNKKFKWIFYFPIDSTPMESWVKECISIADFPITYTRYGYEECVKKDEALRGKLDIIYHGVNTKDFYPLPLSEARMIRGKMFKGKADDKFIFMNLNRNQPRKDIFRTMLAFSELKKERKNIFLYLHMKPIDAGWNLFNIDKQLGLKLGEDWSCPDPKLFSENVGFPVNILNGIYNAVDAVISTTLGEGYGLSAIEGIATKRLIIMPNNTSMPEIIGNNERGLLVDSGIDPDHLICLHSIDNDRIRPLTSVADLIRKMKWAMDNESKVKIIIENAYNWAREHQWDSPVIKHKWIKIFEMATNEMLKDRNNKIIKSVAGNNFLKKYPDARIV